MRVATAKMTNFHVWWEAEVKETVPVSGKAREVRPEFIPDNMQHIENSDLWFSKSSGLVHEQEESKKLQ